VTGRGEGAGRRRPVGREAGGPVPRLLVCTALGIEARAVRRGLPADVTVRRTGMGPVAAGRAVLPAFEALAVTGFGGALDDELRPGDVLVASEVRFDGEVLACPSAAFLMRELTLAGLRAYTGPLVTVDRLVTGRFAGRAAGAENERPWASEARAADATGRLSGGEVRVAAGRARAVDMETGPLARAAAGRPFAAVRVIVDTPSRPLLSPATVRGGLAARRTLRRLGPVLVRWAVATAGPFGTLRSASPGEAGT
jgi:4-hydroxy-3-methylbut-2-enyl diphosphate reductase